ncbi:hypothetical protein Pmar_PMAR017765 [Perkinsus marinus ATCC 50983]|uniref:Uncharacterized protein n=1 Tax=Perkinsus marinus (strain ATCC 50983 / TXsc) TaxID=423536 RepID=C5L3X8_PERM5|nr:hypothetical protein Pmar_PMAR017765 [Perkinsus marinus ATCC 50983]EER08707.1 hypothetical protein Pmar_PMAR017765 [Perkinsus marinus ATCC 50983]|eukprot:XP_002776891.1 hypothetical protein Pmar_PMAR017765 [Perkinsus marinus ATCC 50983]
MLNRRPSSIEVRITSLEPIAESDGEYGTAGESGVHDKCALEALNYSAICRCGIENGSTGKEESERDDCFKMFVYTASDCSWNRQLGELLEEKLGDFGHYWMSVMHGAVLASVDGEDSEEAVYRTFEGILDNTNYSVGLEAAAFCEEFREKYGIREDMFREYLPSTECCVRRYLFGRVGGIVWEVYSRYYSREDAAFVSRCEQLKGRCGMDELVGHNRPPWTYTDAPGLVIGDDARVKSEPLDNDSGRACGPQEGRRAKPFLKEFAYSTKGNYGGLFDPNIGRLGEGVGKVAADRSRDEEGKGAGEKTRPTPWCTQPLTLDYFDKKMAKESIGKMRGKQGNKCLEDVQRWQRYHRRSGIKYWEKVERDYRARVRDRGKLLKRGMAADAAEREGAGRGEAEGTAASILTTPSERRILLAVGDPRHWSGDDRCGDVLSALEAAGVEPVLHLIEKFTAPYQLPVIARSADA